VLTLITRIDRLKDLNGQRHPRISVYIGDPPEAPNDIVISGTARYDDQDSWDEARELIACYNAPHEVVDDLAR
jgi:hypothetical protein